MKSKWAIFAVLLFLVANPVTFAVNTRDIEKVRNKSVLDNKDLQIIDDFVGQAVQELVKTKDFTSIAKVRSVILAYSRSKDSGQAQYCQQFSDSAYQHISSALKQAQRLTPENRKFKVILNLLILIDALEDLRLAELALEQLKDEMGGGPPRGGPAIRYWAVHSVTNPAIIEQLNTDKPANLQLAERIVKQLTGLVETAGPETLSLMAKFAARIDIPQAEELLVQIADIRISKYANWTVDYELADATILKLLCERLEKASRKGKSAIAQRFAQLYSYAIQRYVKGRDFLKPEQKHQLASVLVEIERACIGKLVGMPQSVIKRAVEQDDYMGLLQEHSRLLGDETRPGKLASKLNFDYGRNPDGSKRTAPLTLPAPPRARIS